MTNVTDLYMNITELNDKGQPVKVFLSMTPCFFSLYINIVMLVTLRSKAIFRETSRYILFTHMLFADSLQLLISMMIYILAVVRVYITGLACFVMVVTGGMVSRISPLNLAVMALERYIAICFPLRHAQLATSRRTGLAIAIVWGLGSLNTLTDVTFFVISGSSFVTMWEFCSGSMMLQLEVCADINAAFQIICFVSVGIIIIYTYICIVMAARSVAVNKVKATKAHNTVMLHLIQLVLCLLSTFFDTIALVVKAHLNRLSAINIQYFMFLGLVIFPRCLSPLIYGLRDQTFKPLLKYYFTFGTHTIKPVHITL